MARLEQRSRLRSTVLGALTVLVGSLACSAGLPYPPRLGSEDAVLEIGDDGTISELTAESQQELLRYDAYSELRPGDHVQFKFEYDPPPKPDSKAYRIEQGDILQILFVDDWAYNSFVTVRPDGFVSPTGIRDVRAGGRPVADVQAEINQLYHQAGVLGTPGLLGEPVVTVAVNYIDPGFPSRFDADLLVYEDGTLLHPTLGRFDVAGRYPRDIEAEALERIPGRIMNPVKVQVSGVFVGGRFVFLGGECYQQGRYDFLRKLTLSQVVFSGGVKETADLLRVVLMRRGQDGRLRSFVVNVKRNFEPGSARGAAGDVSAAPFSQLGAFEVPVRPEDVIYVPKTTVARMNQFVDEWFNKMLPLQKAISASYTYGTFGQ